MTAPNRASVLVVDDTVENLQLLSAMLEEHGYEVRPVTGGRQAIAAAKSFPPDVILLDVSMPEMDGYDVCRALKEIDDVRDVPVVFLTALTETGDKVRAFAAGGADYVTKPFHVEEVLARVKVQVELRRSRRELFESYQRLQALERLRDDLVQMVVHDMRSPLGALVMLIDLVRGEARDALSAEAMQDLHTAIESAMRVNRMANDLLDVSRMEEGKLPLDPKRHELAQICREVVDELSSLDRTRPIDVAEGAPVEVSCDRGVVRRVVQNLVSNALKHTPAGGRIGVSVTTCTRGARVTVRDEGAGVPLEARTKIFEKFGSVEARRDAGFHSAGVGLAFCKLAVEAHGGSIGVDSAEPRGSVFWFELPTGAGHQPR